MTQRDTVSVLQTLLERGGKYIVIQGLLPTGCLPLDISLSPEYDRDKTGCANTANEVIKSHNDILQKKVEEHQKKYPDSIIIYADLWKAYYAVRQNPSKFGFSEEYKACCGSGGGELNFDLRSLCGARGTTVCSEPSKYMNWDGVHLTQAMHHVLSDLLLNKGYSSPSFDHLIQKKRSCTAPPNS